MITSRTPTLAYALKDALGEGALDLLLADATLVEVSSGDEIVREGEHGDALYVVLEGDAIIHRHSGDGRDTVVANCGPGEHFGEAALLPGRSPLRSAGVRARTRMRLLRIEREHFQRALAADRAFKRRLEERADSHRAAAVVRSSALLDALGLSDNERAASIAFERGTSLFGAGEPARALYFVISGAVEVYVSTGDGDHVISTLGGGHCFGEVGLLEDAPRTASARVIEDARLLVISAEHVRATMSESPRLAGIFRELKRSYKLPRRGTVTQYVNRVDGQDAITTVYELEGHRSVVAVRSMRGESFTARVVGETATNRLRYADREHGVERSLGLSASGALVELVVHGPWIQLSEVFRLLLDGVENDAGLTARFEEAGSIALADVNESPGVRCVCVGAGTSAVIEALRVGDGSFSELQAETGCGTVCGSCVPAIRHFVDNGVWRPAVISEDRFLAEGTREFAIKPLDGPAERFVPGQHIVLSGLVDGMWVQRAYTLTTAGDPAPEYRIAVKREPSGVFSNWLFSEGGRDAILQVSSPRGSLCWSADDRPTVCLVAGIGCTPALAIVAAHTQRESSSPLHVDYSAGNRDSAAALDALSAAAEACGCLTLRTRFTSDEGRIDEAAVAALASQHPAAQYVICGPESYAGVVMRGLRLAGVSDAAIHTESFVLQSESRATKNDGGGADVRGGGARRASPGVLKSLLRSVFGRG